MKVVGLIIALSVLLAGCPLAPVCEQLQTQCAGNRVEVCDPHGRWREVMNCSELYGDGEWACAEHAIGPELEHTCLPEGE